MKSNCESQAKGKRKIRYCKQGSQTAKASLWLPLTSDITVPHANRGQCKWELGCQHPSSRQTCTLYRTPLLASIKKHAS